MQKAAFQVGQKAAFSSQVAYINGSEGRRKLRLQKAASSGRKLHLHVDRKLQHFQKFMSYHFVMFVHFNVSLACLTGAVIANLFSLFFVALGV